MKVFEVLQKPIRGLKTTSKKTTGIITHPSHQILDVGGQAIATLHKRFPNKVIKTIQIYGTDDPVYQFLRLALKHQNNPYFPRIYAVKQYDTQQLTYSDREDQFSELDVEDKYSPAPSQLEKTLFVVMERLYPLSSIDYQVLEKLGIEDVEIPAYMQQHFRVDEIKFRTAFNSPKWRKVMYNTVQDKYFKQALRLLEPLFRHYVPDMHDSNIMTRDNGHWVIIDPVSHNNE